MRENSEEAADLGKTSHSVPRENPLESRKISGCLSLFFAGAALLGCLFGAAMCSQLQIPARAKRTDSRVLGKGLADSIIQFYGDYGQLPVPFGQNAGSLDLTADTSEKSGLIRILLGKEPDGPSKQNIRNINYLEGMKTARRGQVSEGPKWRGGLISEDGECAAADGWGNFFQVRLDTNGDGAVENSNNEEIRDGRRVLPFKVVIWSPGKDHREETWEDNVKSWD